MISKITFVTNYLGAAGVEKVFVNLANQFCQEGITVDILLCKKEGDLLELANPQINIIGLNCSLSRSPIKFFKFLSKNRPELIIAGPEFLSFILIAINIICFRGKIRIIPTQHSVNDLDLKELGYIRHIERFLIRFLYNKAFRVVGVSENVCDYLLKCGLKHSSIKKIYNPAITDQLFSLATQEIKDKSFNKLLESKAPIVMSIGRLHNVKNYSLLIRAAKQVCSKKECYFVIIGEGCEKKALENLIKELEIESSVYLVGSQINPYCFLNQAQVLVSSSYSETFSLTIVEALALGKKVVSTATFGALEVLDSGRFGTIVPINDEQAMTAAILDALEIGKEDTRNRENLPIWLEQFKVKNVASKYFELAN